MSEHLKLGVIWQNDKASTFAYMCMQFDSKVLIGQTQKAVEVESIMTRKKKKESEYMEEQADLNSIEKVICNEAESLKASANDN